MVTPVINDPAEADRLAQAMLAAAPAGTLVLTGAGISTESGIPDYRGESGRARPATPMTYQDFVGSVAARQRYWARSHLGWWLIAHAQPNLGHRAVAGLQVAGVLGGIITQNVDGLHQAAGADDVVELHGGLDRVICLNCRALSDRSELDERLTEANPQVDRMLGDDVKPDGDIDVSPDVVEGFRIVDCLDCGTGPLKPDVVFFGENVPPERVARSYALVDASRMLLVLGSSLTVASGFRFVRRAHTRGVTVAIVNQGETRGDPLADLKIEAPLGAALTDLVQRIGAGQLAESV
jgi:NAD-dependent SIR2 family protein deacetylase